MYDRIPKKKTQFQAISTGYVPRELQAKLHRDVKRFSVLVMHRRFGKTVFSVNHMIDKALRNPLNRPQYAYIAPFRDQAKKVAWEYMKEYTSHIPGADPNEADLRVDIPRPSRGDHIRLMLLGADNPKGLKGMYLDGVVPDEYAEMYPSVWTEVLRPMLSDRLGWAMFLGTPKGRNHFFELFNYAQTSGNAEWFSAMYKASETNIIPAAELESARATMSEDEYLQEYECSFQAGLVGAYFSKEIMQAEKDNRFGRVPFDPSLPLDTYWDLGINDSSAVWFVQQLRLDYRIVSYFEEPDLNIPKLVRMVKDVASQNQCDLGRFILPHDAKVRDLGTGKSRFEVFKSLGCKVTIVPKVEDKGASIHAARMIFPKCQFDGVRCKRGIEALMNYQRRWDSKQSVFSQRPLHNWASNGADAFQQFAMAANDRGIAKEGIMPTTAETNYSLFGRR